MDTTPKGIDEIKDIFSNINSWVNYAEIKIGAILTFNIALIVLLLDNLVSENKIVYSLQYASIILLSISGLLLLLAQFPVIGKFAHRISLLKAKPKINYEYNWLYYADIASVEVDVFCDRITKTYQMDKMSKLTKHYLQEIHTNSVIAYNKFLIAKLSMYFSTSAVLISVISIAIFYHSAR